MGNTDIEIIEKGMPLVEFYRKHPIIAAKDLLNIELAVPQRQILKDFWFKNFVLVSAGRGTGKCVVGGTLIATDKGVFSIEELGSNLIPLSDIDLVVEGFSKPVKATKWYFDGVQKVNTIRTSFGYGLSGTDDHKIKILEPGGNLVWKQLSDVIVGDYVAIYRDNGVWAKEKKLTVDEATVLGLLVGDGCFRGNKYNLGFTNEDAEVLAFYKEKATRAFGVEPKLYLCDGRCPELRLTRKSVWGTLESWGVRNNILSGDKEVPTAVLKSSKEVIVGFLRGLFEADGGRDCEGRSLVSYSTKSKLLAKQVHFLLLNLGIVACLIEKIVDGVIYYIIEIGSHNVDRFSDSIGFISSRKRQELSEIIGWKRNQNKDTIPGLSSIFLPMWDKTRGVVSYKKRERLKRYKHGKENPTYRGLLKEISKYPFDDEFKERLCFLYEKNYFYDVVTEKSFSHDDVYDLVVPEDHSFVANGFVNHNTFLDAVLACLWALLFPGQKIGLLAPSFRQAKMLFSEVEKIWGISPLLREATERKPIRQSDRCVLTFRQAGNRPASVIEAVPLGDGSKIRGARYYVIIADEFAQIPVEIFNTVILPMGATVANPMENVKRISHQKELIRRGMAEEGDFQVSGNKVIMTSSAFYQFNHMYETLLSYEQRIITGETKYAVHRISYKDMPEGFLSDDNIANARSRLSSIEFRMEYEARWEADSAGVFKASLIEKCRRAADHTVSFKGNPGSEYVLGVDPARASDAFALCMIELGSPNKLVAAWEYYQNVFPKMAQTIIDLSQTFNIKAVHMDAGAGGGGLAMKDLLAEEERFGTKRILDVDDEDTEGLAGQRILHMFNPAPKSTAEAVYASLNLLEKDGLTLPKRPQPRGSSDTAFSDLDTEEEIYDTIERMIRQIMLIEVSESRSGVAHFDVPSGGGHASQKKDLYTSFVLAAKLVYDMSIADEDIGTILELGILENRNSVTFGAGTALNNSLQVTPAPVNSWSYRKTFKPGR